VIDIRNGTTTTDRGSALALAMYFGRGERIRTSGLYVPNVALYQAKLHPVLAFSRNAARLISPCK
jgi:hypothetical protein